MTAPLTQSDCDTVAAILPAQLAIELVRSKSVALVSDAMRQLTEARAKDRLSEDGFQYMIAALAEVLCPPKGRPQ